MSEPPTTRRKWLLTALPRKRSCLLLAIVLVCVGILFNFQGPRCCLYGWLRFEPTYRWLPASYWRAAILDRLRPPVASTVAPTGFLPLVRYEWERYYDGHWSLAVQARHLNHRDPKMLALLRCLLDDPDAQVSFQAIGILTLLEKEETREFLPRLVEFLDSPDYLKRWSAIHTLGRIGPPASDALPRLKTLFAQETRDELKLNLAYAIRQIEPSDQESLEYLISLLKSGTDVATRNKRLVAGAAGYLRLLQPPPREALPILIELAGEDDPQIAQAAFITIQRIDPELAKREDLLQRNWP